MILTIIVNFALTPFLISQLGTASYGLWTLALTLSITHGFLSFADFGMASSIVKMVGGYCALGKRDEANTTISGGLLMLGSIGFLACLVILLGGEFLLDIFKVEPELTAPAANLIRLMALVVFVDLIRIPLSATLNGLQEFTRAKLIQMAGLLAQAGLMVLFVFQGSGLPGLGMAALFSSVCQLVLCFFVLRSVIPWWRLTVTIPTDIWNHLFRTSSFILIIRLQSAVYKGMDRVIIGLFLVPAVLTQYDIVFKLAGVGIAAITVISSMMVSPAAESAATNNIEQLGQRFVRSTKYALLLSLPVVVVILLYAKEILSLWVGPAFINISLDAMILAGHVIFVALMASGQNMLIGAGGLKPVALVTSMTTAMNLVLSLLLVGPLGLRGVILATLASTAVSAGLFVRLGMRHFKVGPGELTGRLIVPALVPALSSILAFYLAGLVLGPTGNNMLPGLLIVMAVYASVALIFSVEHGEKSEFLAYFSSRRED